jgi:hypothetical protein
MQFQFGGQCQMLNPQYTIIAVAPRDGQPGRIGFSVVVPCAPPLTVVMLFDRNQAEELLKHMREANDTSKGLPIK